MGHKKKVIKFGIVLNCCALIFFIISFATKLHILTLFGFILLFGAVYLQYIYLPQLKKKKKEQNFVLEEVHASEIAKPKITFSEYIDKCWDKFIVWLHT